MGCCNSNCMRDCKPDVEIRLHSRQKSVGEILLMRPEHKQEKAKIEMKDYVEKLPDLAKINKQKKEISFTTFESTKPTRSRVYDTNQTNMDYSTNQTDFPWEQKLQELQLRIGKTFTDLNREYETIMEGLRLTRRDYLNSTATNLDSMKEERLFTVLNQWKSFVYEDICRKTGEIKNIVTYNSSGKYFCLAHEIDGWSDIRILKDFCEFIEIEYDDNFFKKFKARLEAISTLTIMIWIEITDTDNKFNIDVGCSISKPEDKRTLRKYLDGTVEKDNILTWFNANTPVPQDFGFTVGESDSHVLTGFYFFEGPPYMNLSKSLSAFQAYGADINKILDVLRNIPGEELKVSFLANQDGVQRVRLLMFKLPQDLENEILEYIDKAYEKSAWNQFKASFGGITLRTYYILEFTCDGFSLYCSNEVGQEIGANAYFEDL